MKNYVEWYEEFYGAKYVYASPSSDFFIDSRTEDEKSACRSACSVDSELFPDATEDDKRSCES